MNNIEHMQDVTKDAEGQSRLNDGLGVTFPATRTVHWPSGPVNTCDNHTAQLVGLSNFLGAYVGVTAAPDNSQCANCMNEAKLTPNVE